MFDKEPVGDKVSIRPDYGYFDFDLEAHNADAHKRGLRSRKIMSAWKKLPAD